MSDGGGVLLVARRAGGHHVHAYIHMCIYRYVHKRIYSYVHIFICIYMWSSHLWAAPFCGVPPHGPNFSHRRGKYHSSAKGCAKSAGDRVMGWCNDGVISLFHVYVCPCVDRLGRGCARGTSTCLHVCASRILREAPLCCRFAVHVFAPNWGPLDAQLDTHDAPFLHAPLLDETHYKNVEST